MDTRKLDYANISLMIVSCLLAYILPFELFLFSYAVIGPLHYLTEIAWLHERQYFTTGRFDYLLFVIIGVFVFILSYLISGYENSVNALIFGAFFYALATIVFQQAIHKLLFATIALVAGLILQDNYSFMILFGVFLPTIIHVFIFTWLFILYGALKNKSETGIFSLLIFFLAAFSFFFYQPQYSFYEVADYAEKALLESNFVILNKSLLAVFQVGNFTRETIFESSIGLSVMRFIAFTYTYHYLNWFSKTQIIKWHKVPRRQIIKIAGLWIFSVMLYACNYTIGLVALSFLSMLHVLMEFPLNYKTLIGIIDELCLFLRFSKSH